MYRRNRDHRNRDEDHEHSAQHRLQPHTAEGVLEGDVPKSVADRRLVLVREWTAVTILTMCYFGFVAVISTWGTAAPESISPYAAILGMLAAANVLATGPNGL